MFTQEMQSAVGKGKSKKTRLFLFAAAEILSPRCRVLSSITNLSLGLDGHWGAVLALLALSASLFFISSTMQINQNERVAERVS